MTGVAGPVEVFESGTPQRPARRRLVTVLVVVALIACGGLWFRQWSAERAVRQAVVLSTTFGVTSSSTSPAGGSVRFFVLVRNDGVRPVTVLSVDAAEPGLRVRMLEPGGRRVDAGGQSVIPLSARLTCADRPDPAAPVLPAAVVVRRADGGSVTRRIELGPATSVLDAATTLCAAQPGLRDHELSGPVSRAG